MPPRLTAGLARVAWAVAILLVAVAAVGLQMDREARKHPAIAAMVPPLFRGYALDAMARNAYRAGDNKQGLAYSRDLVSRRPVPAEGLALLTNGLLLSGQGEAALPVLLLSAQRGWRDWFTQRLVIGSALQAGEPVVAAERLLALWRQGDQSLQTRNLTISVLATRGGQDAFARGIVENDHGWGTTFIIWGVDNLPRRAVFVIAASMARKRVDVKCARLSDAAGKWVRVGYAATATVLWSALCAKGRMPDLANFGFRPGVEPVDPFDWQFPDRAGVDTELERTVDGTTLHFTNFGQFRAIVALRNAALPPGRYVARIDIEGGFGIDTRPLFLQITCFSESGAAAAGQTVIESQRTFFQIPAAGCVGQQIAILVPAGEGRIRRLSIDAEK